jgi:hypothetical protein
MGKHDSGYERIERDHYPTTPAWPIAALAEYVTLRGKTIWEMACGQDHMARSLRAEGATVFTSDVADYGLGQDSVFDFLASGEPAGLPHCHLMATNPPFGKGGRTAVKFIEVGLLRLLSLPLAETLALLLPTDFDAAKTRAHLFGDCPHFVGKIMLRRRIMWFSHPTDPTIGPKENSAWFLWTRAPHPRPVKDLMYAPRESAR